MKEIKIKTVMTGQFEGSRKYLRIPEHKNDKFYKFIKKLVKKKK
jgi:hypothetical protein